MPRWNPNELIECIHGLADWCGFPSNEEKERNIQYWFVHALSDSDLIYKFLALKLTATTSEMLELCCTHIAISDNMNSMDLAGSKTVNAICWQKQQHQGQQSQQQKSQTTSTAQHTCSNCTKSHTPGRSSCPAKDSVCSGCGHTGHWQPFCMGSGGPQATKKPQGTEKKQGGHCHNCQQCGHRWTDVVDVGEYLDTQPNKVSVAWVTLQHDHELLGTDPKYITIANTNTNTRTEAFTIMMMPADIGPSQLGKVCCKVDTDAGGNVMPLHVFQKLFPSPLDANGKPTGLCPTVTQLTTYNGSAIPELGAHDTVIKWRPRPHGPPMHVHTWWYIADTSRPAILGLPSSSKLGIMQMNCTVQFAHKQEDTTNLPRRSATEHDKVADDLSHLWTLAAQYRWSPLPPLNSSKDLIAT